MDSGSDAPCYSVGCVLEVDWPLLTGGHAPFRATVRAIASAKRRNACADSRFRYLLHWHDGSPESWQTLRRVSHRPVREEGRGTAMPWKDRCEAADHAETPLAAYRDVVRILEFVAGNLGKDPETLQIYDPYYCAGAVVEQLRRLGFLSVYNRPVDCYAAWKDQEVPAFDVLVTNPPYSGDHVDRLFKFAASCGRPCLMLVPNFTIEAACFDAFDAKSLLLLGPMKRYSYRSPASLRPDLGNKQRKYVAPYVTLWVLLLGPTLRKLLMRAASNAVCPPHCVLVRRRDALPAALRGVAKASEEALQRKAFNDFCRAHDLGKLCFAWAKEGSCGCAAAHVKGPFRHPTTKQEIKEVRLLLSAFFGSTAGKEAPPGAKRALNIDSEQPASRATRRTK